MAISFPTGLDNFTNPSSGNTLDSPSHSLQHSDLNDAVEALERKVGVGTAVAGSASAGQVLTISAAGTSTWSTPSTQGLIQIVPSSISVGSGSGSVDANGRVSFTSATSISINDVFSSTYENYKIMLNIQSPANPEVGIRMRVGGVDNSSSIYYSQRLRAQDSTVSAARQVTQTYFPLGPAQVSQRNVAIVELNNPFAAIITTMTATMGLDWYELYLRTSLHDTATSYTGFSTVLSSSNITGTISVYGYK